MLKSGAEIGCYFIVIFVKMLLNNVCGGAVVGLSLLDCSCRCIKKTKKNGEGVRLEKKTMEEEETDNTKSVSIYSYIFSCLNDLNRFDTGRGQRAEVYI